MQSWKPWARRALVALGVLAVVIGAVVVAAMLALQSGWAERRIEAAAAERLGREVELQGLRLLAAWPPQIELAVLRVRNPEWAKEPWMLDARGLRATLEPGPLWRGRVVSTVAVDEAAAALQMDGERASWSFAGAASDPDSGVEGGASRVEIRSASIGELRAGYLNLPEETELAVRASGELGREGRPFRAEAEGRLRGEPLRASASAPSVPLAGDRPVELSFEAALGRTKARGKVAMRAAAQALQSMQGSFEVSGPSFAALSRVVRGDLPASAPYRVAADVRHEKGRWDVDNFRLRLGESDLDGAILFDASGERPFVRAELESDLFDLKETGIRQEVKEELQEKYLVPRWKWRLDFLSTLDVELDLELRKVRNARPVPFDALALRAVLEDARLRVDPFRVALASGTVKGRVALDAGANPERGSMLVDMRGLRLSRLMPKLKGAETALGVLNGRVELSGAGDTPAQMIGSADGRILFASQGGTASGLLVELLGLDAAEAATLLGRKHVKEPLKCAVMNLEVKNGKARPSPFVIDATDTVLSVEGTIDLGKERLALTARAEPRDASPFTLRTPADIEGTFLDPQIKPRKGPLIARGAGALALGALSPFLALIPFVDPGGDPEGGCQPQKR